MSSVQQHKFHSVAINPIFLDMGNEKFMKAVKVTIIAATVLTLTVATLAYLNQCRRFICLPPSLRTCDPESCKDPIFFAAHRYPFVPEGGCFCPDPKDQEIEWEPLFGKWQKQGW